MRAARHTCALEEEASRHAARSQLVRCSGTRGREEGGDRYLSWPWQRPERARWVVRPPTVGFADLVSERVGPRVWRTRARAGRLFRSRDSAPA